MQSCSFSSSANQPNAAVSYRHKCPLTPPHSPKHTPSREKGFSLLAPTADPPRSSRQASQANLIPAHFVTDMSPQRDAASTHVLPCRIGPVPVGAALAEIPEDSL